MRKHRLSESESVEGHESHGPSLCRGCRWRWFRESYNALRGPHGCCRSIGAGGLHGQGPLREAAACPHSTLPGVAFPALDPKGRQKPETGGWLSPTAAKLFCLLPSVICFSAVLSWLYLSLLLKPGSAAVAVTADASLHVSLPLLFSSCLFPFLSLQLLLRFVRKDWPFTDTTCRATVLLSVFVG